MLRSRRIEHIISANERIQEKDVLDYYLKNQGGYSVRINNRIELNPGEDINLGDQYPEDVNDLVEFTTGTGEKKVLVIMKVLRSNPTRKTDGFIIDQRC